MTKKNHLVAIIFSRAYSFFFL